MSTVITYSSGRDTITITPSQADRLRAAGIWPRDNRGQEYCSVQHGQHSGHADFTDDDIDRIIGGENAAEIRDASYGR